MLFKLIDHFKAPVPEAERVDWLRDWRFAHRGLHQPGVPENSRAAFAAAIARGMGIECDIQRSSDGQAMVFHDHELDRLTAESGPVSQYNAETLGQIPLKGSTETIPTLRQVLEQVDGQVPLLIEIKSRRGDNRRLASTCLAVRRVLEGYTGPHAVMSFDPRVVRWFSEHSVLTVRGLVVTEENDKALPGMIRRRLALWHARPDFLAYDIRDLPSRFAAAQRRRGLPITTWTVRDPDQAENAMIYADAPIAEGAGIP